MKLLPLALFLLAACSVDIQPYCYDNGCFKKVSPCPKQECIPDSVLMSTDADLDAGTGDAQ